ncbi:hypothetical protein QEH56_14775 [Pelagicoccus enzymogenes]|uniref:alpha-1,3-galactosidase-related protein n=1 Tax=Pelagicoccus enzymogenes TaxID=2773457 RepID=UPI00280EB6E7|nr:hypothetical protein [Pelagicoccus enzymogenes]MDQ8199428.1 hypothetical protein [Pelagicoccus enzymogenes]
MIAIDASEMGLRPGSSEDLTLTLKRAMTRLPESEIQLNFQPGDYFFRGKFAGTRFASIANHDSGRKEIVFDLSGRKDWSVNGNGARFWFSGEAIPFAANEGMGIEVSDLSIDWIDPLIVEARIEEANANSMVLCMPGAVPYLVLSGRLLFNIGGDIFPLIRVMEIDSSRRAPAFASGDNFGAVDGATSGWDFNWRFEQLEGKRIRVEGNWPRMPVPGNYVYCKFGRRTNPGFWWKDSRDIIMKDVSIHYTGAMGVLAEGCENVALTRVKVIPPEDCSRLTSARADATHFVCCRGDVDLVDCKFHGQHDDGANVHGIYFPVVKILGKADLIVERAHFQQRGCLIGKPGDRYQFVRANTLASVGEFRINEFNEINDRYVELILDSPLPLGVKLGDGIENLSASPALRVEGCSFEGNRARGLLVGTPRKALVVGCTFHVPGSAIRVSSDCGGWYESGAVKDFTIRNNRFLNTNYATPGWPHWGLASIDLEGKGEPVGSVVSGVRVENNSFVTFGPPVLNAAATRDLVFSGNNIESSQEFPWEGEAEPLVYLGSCLNTAVHSNENTTARKMLRSGPMKFAPVQVNRGYK